MEIEMELLESKPPPPLLPNLLILTEEERATLYSVVEADLMLEIQVLRNVGQSQVLSSNPYFFMGSHIVKAWLDATTSAINHNAELEKRAFVAKKDNSSSAKNDAKPSPLVEPPKTNQTTSIPHKAEEKSLLIFHPAEKDNPTIIETAEYCPTSIAIDQPMEDDSLIVVRPAEENNPTIINTAEENSPIILHPAEENSPTSDNRAEENSPTSDRPAEENNPTIINTAEENSPIILQPAKENSPTSDNRAKENSPTSDRPAEENNQTNNYCPAEKDSLVIDHSVEDSNPTIVRPAEEKNSTSDHLAEENSPIMYQGSTTSDNRAEESNPTNIDTAEKNFPGEEDSLIIDHCSPIIVRPTEGNNPTSDCSAEGRPTGENCLTIDNSAEDNCPTIIIHPADENIIHDPAEENIPPTSDGTAESNNSSIIDNSAENNNFHQYEETVIHTADYEATIIHVQEGVCESKGENQQCAEKREDIFSSEEQNLPDIEVLSDGNHSKDVPAIINERRSHTYLDLSDTPQHKKESIEESHPLSDPESAHYTSVIESPEAKGSTQSLPPTMSEDLILPQSLTRRVSSQSVNWSSYLTRKYSRGDYTISGDMYIRIKHVKETLYVTIVEARNLAATDKKGHCNPYVKLYLLPDLKTSKRKTRIEKRSLNPFFNQTFEYPLPKELLGTRAVWLSVWNKTKLSQLFLGEICIPLAATKLPQKTYKQWQPLEDYSESDTSQDTDILISSHKSSPHLAEKENPVDLQQAVEQGGHVHPKPDDLFLTEGVCPPNPHPEKNAANVDEDEASVSHPAEESIIHPPISPATQSPADDKSSPIHDHQAEDEFSINLDLAEEQTLANIKEISPELLTEGNNSVDILKAELKSLNEGEMDSLVNNNSIESKLPEQQDFRTEGNSWHKREQKLPGIQIRTDERGAQIVRPVSNVYAIENEYSIHISDTASDLENTPTHDRKELPTGARTPFSDAEFDYTPLSNKFLAADDFKGSTRSLPPTLPAELSLPQTLRQRSSSNYQLSIGGSPHLTRKLSKYTISPQSEQGQIFDVIINRPSRGDYTISGDMYIRIKHVKETLYVTIVEARNLAATDKKGHCNPYVKLYLLPDLKTSKRKTRIEKRSLNPFFNQTFEYPLPKELLGTRAVWLSVWNKTKLSQLFLGEICIPLAATKLPQKTYKQWQPLEDYSESDTSQDTDILISSHKSSPHLAEKENPVDLQQAVEQGGHVHPKPDDLFLTEGVCPPNPHPEKNAANVDEDEASVSHPAEESIIHPPISPATQSPADDKSSPIHDHQAEDEFSINLDLAEKQTLANIKEISPELLTKGNNSVDILKAELKSLNEGEMDSLVNNNSIESKLPEQQDFRTEGNSWHKREQKLPGIQIRTDERGAQIVRPVSNVYAIENEYSIHISDTASDLENTPTHDRKELPTGARTPFSDAEFDYTPLSNKFLAADDFKGSTRSLPPTLPAELSLPQTLRQRSSSNYQLSIGGSPHLTRKLSKYTISPQSEQGQIFDVIINRPSRGDYTISGDMYIRIKHVKETLYVTIVEARNLAATDKKGHCNPYVKLYLLPDLKTSKRKTRIEKRSLNPFFNQTFEYPLPKELLGTRAVWLSVWSKTKLSQLFLGEICIPLAATKLPQKTYKQWQPLEDYSESDTSQDTDILISSHKSSPHPAEKENLVDLRQTVEQGSHVHPKPDDLFLTEGVCPPNPHPEKNAANVDEGEASVSHPAEESIIHPPTSPATQSPADDKSSPIHDHQAEDEFSINLDLAEKQTLANIKKISPELLTEGNNSVDILKAELKSLNEGEMGSLVNNNSIESKLPEQQDFRTEGNSWHKREQKLPGIQIRTDERGAQIVRPVNNVYAIEKEYSIYLSDTESDLENTPTHNRKELPTGARTPLSDAEFDYTPLSNKFLAANDFKGSTRSLPPTLPADELSLPQTLRQRSSSNYQLSIGRSPHLTRKLSKYTISPQSEQGQIFDVTISRPSRGDYTISGDIYIRIKHSNETLYVSMVEGRNLAATDKKGHCNPYIKLYLLPDLKTSKRKTKVDKRTCNPLYNQTFEYPLPKELIDTRTVWLSVWSKTKLSQLFLGESCIHLASTSLPSTTYKQWLSLEDYSESGSDMPSKTCLETEASASSSIPTGQVSLSPSVIYEECTPENLV